MTRFICCFVSSVSSVPLCFAGGYTTWSCLDSSTIRTAIVVCVISFSGGSRKVVSHYSSAHCILTTGLHRSILVSPFEGLHRHPPPLPLKSTTFLFASGVKATSLTDKFPHRGSVPESSPIRLAGYGGCSDSPCFHGGQCTSGQICSAEFPNLFEGLDISGAPNLQLSDAHSSASVEHIFISDVYFSTSGVRLLSVTLLPSKHDALVGPRVLTKWAWILRFFYSISPQTSITKSNNMVLMFLNNVVLVLVLARLIRISGGFTWAFIVRIMSYFSFMKILSVGSPSLVLFRLFPSIEVMTLSSCLLPMAEDVFSDSLPSFSSNIITGLLSCVAICTGSEDATEITIWYLVGEGWLSTSHYVTKFQSFDSVVKALPTHLSFVLNSLLSFFEDLSCFIWLVIEAYLCYERGWIMPSYICIRNG